MVRFVFPHLFEVRPARFVLRVGTNASQRSQQRQWLCGDEAVPAIRGGAWITGITQVIVDPTDPFPEGYLLSDTWPGPDSQQ